MSTRSQAAAVNLTCPSSSAERVSFPLIAREAPMKGAELFVRCLENEGVKTIFGIPGEENIDVMDVLLESPIQFVTTRHEQGAAFMAADHSTSRARR